MPRTYSEQEIQASANKLTEAMRLREVEAGKLEEEEGKVNAAENAFNAQKLAYDTALAHEVAMEREHEALMVDHIPPDQEENSLRK